MKKVSLLLLIELLLTINSCDFLVDQYEDNDVFATYYMGDRCIIVLGGTSIVEKSYYEKHKKKCDRFEYFIIYQEDIIDDYVLDDPIETRRYLKFIANKTNSSLDFGTIGGISTNVKKPNDKYNICTARILEDIKMQDVDSVIIDIFYKRFP